MSSPFYIETFFKLWQTENLNIKIQFEMRFLFQTYGDERKLTYFKQGCAILWLAWVKQYFNFQKMDDTNNWVLTIPKKLFWSKLWLFSLWPIQYIVSIVTHILIYVTQINCFYWLHLLQIICSIFNLFDCYFVIYLLEPLYFN